MVYTQTINARGDLMASKNYYPEYAAQYKREHVDRIAFEVPKGKKEVLRAAATERNTSINKMLVTALEKQYGLDLSREEK